MYYCKIFLKLNKTNIFLTPGLVGNDAFFFLVGQRKLHRTFQILLNYKVFKIEGSSYLRWTKLPFGAMVSETPAQCGGCDHLYLSAHFATTSKTSQLQFAKAAKFVYWVNLI